MVCDHSVLHASVLVVFVLIMVLMVLVFVGKWGWGGCSDFCHVFSKI